MGPVSSRVTSRTYISYTDLPTSETDIISGVAMLSHVAVLLVTLFLNPGYGMKLSEEQILESSQERSIEEYTNVPPTWETLPPTTLEDIEVSRQKVSRQKRRGGNKCPGFSCLTSFSEVESCFPRSYKCDGFPDCEDGSDEEDCDMSLESREEKIHHLLEEESLEDEVQPSVNENEEREPRRAPKCGLICQTSTSELEVCLPKSYKCDGYPDCEDGSDEEGCDTDPDNLQHQMDDQ